MKFKKLLIFLFSLLLISFYSKEAHVSGGTGIGFMSKHFKIEAHTPNKIPIDGDAWRRTLGKWTEATSPKLEYIKEKIEEKLKNHPYKLLFANYNDSESAEKLVIRTTPGWESYKVEISFKKPPEVSVRKNLTEEIITIISNNQELPNGLNKATIELLYSFRILPDETNLFEEKFPSFNSGLTEENNSKINKLAQKVKVPFKITLKKDGKPVEYILVDPKRVTGFLWWKKALIISIKADTIAEIPYGRKFFSKLEKDFLEGLNPKKIELSPPDIIEF